MNAIDQQSWYIILSGLGLFEFVKSRGRSWTPLFCVFSALAILISGAEGALVLTLSVAILILQNFQYEKNEDPDLQSRQQTVLLSAIGGLVFLSSALRGTEEGLISFLIFAYLITMDWPAKGLLRFQGEQKKTIENARALVYLPVGILLANVYIPDHEWVAFTLFATSGLAFLGPNKERGLFLLTCGMLWLRPELKPLFPALCLLCLGSLWTSILLQALVLYLFSTVKISVDDQILLPVYILAGLYIGWMLADRNMTELKKTTPRANPREFILIVVSAAGITWSLVSNNNVEALVPIKPEFLMFLGAAFLMEIIKRSVQSLSKIQVKLTLKKSFQEIVDYIPIFSSKERQPMEYVAKTADKFVFVKIPTGYLENKNLGLGLFALVLWSIVIWHYCNT